MAARLRVGVVGCGLVAQVMHLPYLRELVDLYDVTAICDLSESVLAVCANRFGVERTFKDWRALIAEPLDAVFVLTSGSHAPVAIAAAQNGRHVLVEKPMCFSVTEGQQMLEAADRAGVRLMVGYPLRYDPAYQRLIDELAELDDLRLVRVTTLESPIQPYVGHYPLHRAADLPAELREAGLAEEQVRVTSAIGGADDLARWAYRSVLLDTLVHEFNAVRGFLGEPDQLAFADLGKHTATTILSYAGLQCVIAWVDLPGIARYEMEFAFYAPQRRLTLSFPSPFLRSMPSLLTVEAGDVGSSRSWRTSEIVSYEEAFKRELIAFHGYVTRDQEVRTPGIDGLRDVALCEAAVAAYRSGAPYHRPTDTARPKITDGA